MATVAGLNLLSGKVTLPLTGRWHADVRLGPKQGNAAVAIAGIVAMDLDGIPFNGAVVRSGPEDGSVGVKIVGGSGGLSKFLSEKWYKGTPTIRRIAEDILRETGETLSPLSSSTVLGKSLAAWERSAGSGGRALSLLLETNGGSWRMLADGTVLVVGSETWPAVNPEHVQIAENPVAGSFLIAPSGKPDLVPGVTFLGQRINYIEHEIDSGKIRTRARYGVQPRAALDRLRELDTSTPYSRMWPAVVERQNADKTIDVVVAGRFGLTQVPLRHGLPGFSVNVSAGARVLIGFEADAPGVPFAALWPNGESVESIEFDGGSRGVARAGDPVQIFFPPVMAVTGTITPPGSAFVGTLTITTPGQGIIQGGNGKLLA